VLIVAEVFVADVSLRADDIAPLETDDVLPMLEDIKLVDEAT
jgi:hypothetical protein